MVFDEVSSPHSIDPPPLDAPFQLPHGDIDVLTYFHDASTIDTQTSSHLLMKGEPFDHHVEYTPNSVIARFDSDQHDDDIGGILHPTIGKFDSSEFFSLNR